MYNSRYKLGLSLYLVLDPKSSESLLEVQPPTDKYKAMSARAIASLGKAVYLGTGRWGRAGRWRGGRVRG